MGYGNPVYYRHFNATCWDDWVNSQEGYCDDANDVNQYFSTERVYSNILQTHSDVAEVIDLDINGNSNRITAFWPDDPAGGCDDGWARALNMDAICLGTTWWNKNYQIAHEVGHAILGRAMDEYTYTSGNPGAHSWTSPETEKAAVSEGWADFISAVTYWSRSAAAPYAAGWLIEGDTTDGNTSPEACVHIANSPEAREGNVARFFWDLYDNTTVDESNWGSCSGSSPSGCELCLFGGHDNLSLSIDEIIAEWSEFPNGTANRQTEEDEDHGRNAWDYWYRYNGACAALRLNCLGGQVE